MTAALRHIASIVLLPFVVIVVVPWLLLSREHRNTWQGLAGIRIGGAFGVLIFTAGLVVFAWCVVLFARIGRGTLAPWDPTRNLVAAGPYRHVRNPMISAVAAMLVGEAVFFGSVLLLAWGVLFIAINHVYFLLSEEPGLERRFGAAYVNYRSRVPRWLPRLRAQERSGREEA